MKYLSIFAWQLLVIVTSCSFGRNDKEVNGSLADTPKEDRSTIKLTSDVVGIDFFALLKDSDEASLSKLIGCGESDSTGPYIQKEFISDSLSFSLILFPKKKAHSEVMLEDVVVQKLNNYPDYTSYVFKHRMKAYSHETDYHDDNNIYPGIVEAFKFEDGAWRAISSKKVNSLGELSCFEISILYRK
jgi:hypothetical protein